MLLGQRHNALALADLKERRESGTWKHYRSSQLNKADLPKYAWDSDAPVGRAAVYEEFEEFST
jgi:hypothetical protein